MKSAILSFFLTCSLLSAYAQPTPSEFLGYPLGTRFTPHHQVVDYYRKIAEGNRMMRLETYGKTYEGRPLILAVISSPENIARLEDIRKANLSLLEGGTPQSQPVIIWLSYNVHGNEAVSTEAAMRTAHTLLTSRQELLRNAVIIIDPCLNPDGRDRYVNFYNSVHARIPDATPYSREHWSPGLAGGPIIIISI